VEEEASTDRPLMTTFACSPMEWASDGMPVLSQPNILTKAKHHATVTTQ
jgi:hypothetical protein